MLALEFSDDQLVTTLQRGKITTLKHETDQPSPTSVIYRENEYPEYNGYRITEKKGNQKKSKKQSKKPWPTREEKNKQRQIDCERKRVLIEKKKKAKHINEIRDLKNFRNFNYLIEAAEAAKPVEILAIKPKVIASFPLEHRKEFPAGLPKLYNDKVILPNDSFVPNPLDKKFKNNFVNYNKKILPVYRAYWPGITNLVNYFNVTRYLKSEQGFPGYWLEIEKARNRQFENVIVLSDRVLITAIETESCYYIFINNEDKFFKSQREGIYNLSKALKNATVIEIARNPGLYHKVSEKYKRLTCTHRRRDFEQKDYDYCALTCAVFKGRCGRCNTYLLEKS